jgi:hypothetical protein
MVAFVEEEQTSAFARHVETRYSDLSDIQPQVYPVEAASGAGPLAIAE